MLAIFGLGTGELILLGILCLGLPAVATAIVLVLVVRGRRKPPGA